MRTYYVLYDTQGIFFIGHEGHFADNFFSNVDEESIRDFAKDEG